MSFEFKILDRNGLPVWSTETERKIYDAVAEKIAKKEQKRIKRLQKASKKRAAAWSKRSKLRQKVDGLIKRFVKE